MFAHSVENHPNTEKCSFQRGSHTFLTFTCLPIELKTIQILTSVAFNEVHIHFLPSHVCPFSWKPSKHWKVQLPTRFTYISYLHMFAHWVENHPNTDKCSFQRGSHTFLTFTCLPIKLKTIQTLTSVASNEVHIGFLPSHVCPLSWKPSKHWQV